MSIVKNIEEVKKFVPATVTCDMDLLLPFINNQAESQRLKKIILGPLLYAELVADYNGDLIDPETDYFQFLLKCQMWVTNYALLRAIPTGIVNIAANGINQSSSDNIKPLTMAQIDLLTDDLLATSDEALEDLLSFLEENVSQYEDWKQAPSYTIIKEAFLSSAIKFDEEYAICKSRSTFISIKSFMMEIQSTRIKSVLTSNLYETMVGKIEDNDFDEAELVILPWIKKAIAYLTIWKSIPHISLRITPEGIQTYSRPDRINSKARLTADKNSLDDLKASCLTEGNYYIALIDEYLKANAEDFEDYPQPTEEPEPNSNGKFKMEGTGNIVGF